MAGLFKQRQQDFPALGQASSSGDLAGARKAFAALQNDMSSIKSAARAPSAQNGNGSSRGDLLQALKKALDSGDLSAARQAFSALVEARGHPHRADAAQSTTAASTTQGTDADGDNDGTVGSTVDVRA